MVRPLWVAQAGLVLLVMAGCMQGGNGDVDAPKTVRLTSSAFSEGGTIPVRNTCSGLDVSPPLSITNAPGDAQTFALIMDDPDADDFVHWTFWNLPVSRSTLPEGADLASMGAREGTTGFDEIGYGGPCPPEGETHTYSFRIYAVKGTLDVAQGAPAKDLTAALQDRAVAWGEVRGRGSVA